MNTKAPLYPIALDLEDQPCLVVGGGSVAHRKVEGLLHSGARVTVVAPHAVPALEEQARTARVQWKKREFTPADVDGMRLVFAATNQPDVNTAVAEAARAKGVLCSRADAGPGGDFSGMSILQRGELMIAISTGGDSPAFARWVRGKIEDQLGPEYGFFLDLLSSLRDEVIKSAPASERSQRWTRALNSDAFGLFCSGRASEAVQKLRAELGLDSVPQNQVT